MFKSKRVVSFLSARGIGSRVFFEVIFLLAGSFPCNSCRTRQEVSSAPKYDLIDNRGLMGAVLEPTIRICVLMQEPASSAKPPINETQYLESRKADIKNAILAWIAPLHDFVQGAAVSPSIEFLGRDDGCKENPSRLADALFVFEPETIDRPYVIPEASFIKARIFNDHSYETILHEIGHVFGLNDTYDENAAFTCKWGQPRSVMCPVSGTPPSALFPDDIAGIQMAFCSIHME